MCTIPQTLSLFLGCVGGAGHEIRELHIYKRMEGGGGGGAFLSSSLPQTGPACLVVNV